MARAAARAVGAVAAVASAAGLVGAVAAATPSPIPPAAPLPPAIRFPFPRVIQAILSTSLGVAGRAAIETPFEFRFNAAILAPTFDCVGVYAAADRAHTTWDGRRVVRAAVRERTDDNLGLCTATVFAGVISHLFGAETASPMYDSAARGGFVLPRLNDTTCEKGKQETGRVAGRGAGKPTAEACVALEAMRRFLAVHLSKDGMNQDGRAGLPTGAHPRPYFDASTGYAPVNGQAAGVTNLIRWAPLVEDVAGYGTYTSQVMTAAQAATAVPLLVSDARLHRLTVPPPYTAPDAYAPDFVCGRDKGGGGGAATAATDPDGLCAQARGVVAAVTGLTDRQRLLLHWFDRKSTSIANLTPRLYLQDGFPLEEYLAIEMAVNAFTWDATVAAWAEKLRHDAVRPATLIPSILRNTGDGAAFAPAIRTMPHQEYPSASAAICSGFPHILTALGRGLPSLTSIQVPLLTGQLGDGLPATNTTLTFANLDDLAATCGDSRVWGGLHFPPAVEAGRTLGVAVAKEVLRVMACRAPGLPGLGPCEAEE